MTPFPWSDAIGFGLGMLRLSPDAFWAMTPRELSHAIRAVCGDAVTPMARGDLDALMCSFPDEVTDGRR